MDMEWNILLSNGKHYKQRKDGSVYDPNTLEEYIIEYGQVSTLKLYKKEL